MRKILYLTTILIGQTLIGCTQTNESKKEKITADFFYGTWTDSSKPSKTPDAIILGKANDFYSITGGNTLGGPTAGNDIGLPASKDLKLTYKLLLDKNPIEVEIASKRIDTDSTFRKLFGRIEIIDDRHISWTWIDENGEIMETVKLTRTKK